jgi:hypothetical protein
VATSGAGRDDLRVTTASSPARPSDPRGVGFAIAAGLVLVLAATCWVPHLPNSLWLDETLTFWVVKDGLADALDRAVHYQPQPAYAAVMWLWTQLFGSSEIALRIPSLLAMLGACVALAKLGASLSGDRETGLIATIVFASSFNAFRESVDARSYALGLLVLLCMALSLLRWLEEGRWRDAWLCGALAALCPHLHLFFALTYPAFALYAALRWSRARVSAAQVGIVGLLLGLGALLYGPVAIALAEHGGSYSFTPTPKVGALFAVFVWVPPVAGLLAGLCAAGVVASRAAGEPRDASEGSSAPSLSASLLPREVGLLLAAWVLVPLLLLFAVSTLTEISVFLGRYLIPAIPAVSLLYALALRRVAPAPARVVAAFVIAIAAFAMHERPEDDFRGAAEAVREFSAGDVLLPILLASGVIEGQDDAWLRDPALADYLNAPTAYYPLGGRVVAVPRKLRGQPIAEEILSPILHGAERFAAVEWYGNGADILAWLMPRARRGGYHVERRGFGAVQVAFFTLQRGTRLE